MPSDATSLDSPRASVTSAPLVASYGTRPQSPGGSLGCERSDHHDRSAVAAMRGRHGSHRVLGAQHRAYDVHAHQPVKRILMLFVDVRLLADVTGVVDQRGERPHLVLRPAEHRLDIVLGGDVSAHCLCSAARAGDGRYDRLRPVRVGRVVHDHSVTITSKPLGDRGADTPAGASDDSRALILYSRSHENHPRDVPARSPPPAAKASAATCSASEVTPDGSATAVPGPSASGPTGIVEGQCDLQSGASSGWARRSPCLPTSRPRPPRASPSAHREAKASAIGWQPVSSPGRKRGRIAGGTGSPRSFWCPNAASGQRAAAVSAEPRASGQRRRG